MNHTLFAINFEQLHKFLLQKEYVKGFQNTKSKFTANNFRIMNLGDIWHVFGNEFYRIGWRCVNIKHVLKV